MQAGGEWKGKKVSGYAEHLMRKERISKAGYLQLAHQFDPAKFNADEWVMNAKAAGMRYLIITAKHHDGFAMYPSAVSDFNIIKQTPFQRDPMAELSAACLRIHTPMNEHSKLRIAPPRNSLIMIFHGSRPPAVDGFVNSLLIPLFPLVQFV